MFELFLRAIHERRLLSGPALTFSDVLIRPRHAVVQRHEVDVSTTIAPGLRLPCPIIASPMDTVSGIEMSLAMGRLGGMAVLNRNIDFDMMLNGVQRISMSGYIAAAAISVDPDWRDKVIPLLTAGCKMVCLDAAHGDSDMQVEVIRGIKRYFPQLMVMAGNIATAENALYLIRAGADCLRVGMGSGSICITRDKIGVGVPQLTAIMQVSRVARRYGVTTVADGGIRCPADMAKAIVAGADAVMIGSLCAGASEALGQIIRVPKDFVPPQYHYGIREGDCYLFRVYRGMGTKESIEAGRRLREGEDYHGQQAGKPVMIEGVVSLVPYYGPLSSESAFPDWIMGIRGGIAGAGAWDIKSAHAIGRIGYNSPLAAMMENSHHDVWAVDMVNDWCAA